MEQGSASMEHDGGAQNLKNGRNRGAQIANTEGYEKLTFSIDCPSDTLGQVYAVRLHPPALEL
jgi:hypothetical protein